MHLQPSKGMARLWAWGGSDNYDSTREQEARAAPSPLEDANLPEFKQLKEWVQIPPRAPGASLYRQVQRARIDRKADFQSRGSGQSRRSTFGPNLLTRGLR